MARTMSKFDLTESVRDCSVWCVWPLQRTSHQRHYRPKQSV